MKELHKIKPKIIKLILLTIWLYFFLKFKETYIKEGRLHHTYKVEDIMLINDSSTFHKKKSEILRDSLIEQEVAHGDY